MLTSVVLALAVVSGQGDCTSTPEEFQEFGSLIVGRWSADITLVADWPGMKKKAGEKLIGYTTAHWVADGKGIIGTSVGGETMGVGLWMYDPIAKKIQLHNVGSAGNTLHGVVWKESPTKWGFELTGGGLPDGRRNGGKGHFLFSDGGKTYIVEGNTTLDDKPLLKLHDVYNRLDK